LIPSREKSAATGPLGETSMWRMIFAEWVKGES